jgi:hypothetical protein
MPETRIPQELSGTWQVGIVNHQAPGYGPYVAVHHVHVLIETHKTYVLRLQQGAHIRQHNQIITAQKLDHGCGVTSLALDPGHAGIQSPKVKRTSGAS